MTDCRGRTWRKSELARLRRRLSQETAAQDRKHQSCSQPSSCVTGAFKTQTKNKTKRLCLNPLLRERRSFPFRLTVLSADEADLTNTEKERRGLREKPASVRWWSSCSDLLRSDGAALIFGYFKVQDCLMKMPKVSVRSRVWPNVCRPLGDEEATRTKIKALSSNNYE